MSTRAVEHLQPLVADIEDIQVSGGIRRNSTDIDAEERLFTFVLFTKPENFSRFPRQESIRAGARDHGYTGEIEALNSFRSDITGNAGLPTVRVLAKVNTQSRIAGFGLECLLMIINLFPFRTQLHITFDGT